MNPLTPSPLTNDPHLPHVTDLTEAYLAGGLSDAERTAFEAHVAACAACAEALAVARRADTTLADLFGRDRPGEEFEDRVIGRLRLAPATGARRREPGPAARVLLHPAVRRVAGGAAAAIVLAAVGYATRAGLQEQSLPFMHHGPQLADLRADLAAGRAFGPPRAPMAMAANRSSGGVVAVVVDRSASMSSPEALGRQMADRLDLNQGWSLRAGPNTWDDVLRTGQMAAEAGKPADGEKGEKAPAHEPAGPTPLAATPPPFTPPPAPAAAVSAPAAAPGVAGGLPGGAPAGGGFGGGGASGGPGGGGGAGGAAGRAADGRAAANLTNGDLTLSAAPGPDRTYGYRGEELLKSVDGGAAPQVALGRHAEQPKDQVAAPGGATSFASEVTRTYGAAAPAGAPDTAGGAAPPAKPAEQFFALGFRPGAEFERFKEAGEPARAGPKDGATPEAARKDQPGPAGATADMKQLERGATSGSGAALGTGTGAAAGPAQPGDGPQPPGETTPGPAPVPPVPPLPPATPPPATPPPPPPATIQRKIIRNGEMTFEVDSYDSSMTQIVKIAGEESGFVATTDSEKLANGKVKGTVIVRCPPERLDTLVLKLRALGELKNQKIAAQDVTKLYTDLESQLTAAKAMEERLMQIIREGKGQIKDLLEAEKQHGVWVEKVESLKGEINYYNNLISLCTLTITLVERDIKTPYATAQTERVSMGVEAEDVEKARADAIREIEQAKGRIIESELKKLEAGQFSATIVADVPPDGADPLVDRLKTVGHVTRLDRERRQTSEGGTGAPPPGVHMERKDTRVQLTINNLANVAPRTTTTMRLAAPDVEKAYRSIIEQVKAGGGRVVASQLNRPKAEQVTGTVTFDVPSEKADVLSTALRTGVEVMRLDVNENKDTLDVTDSKKGFSLEIFSLASVAPRETTTLTIASRDVPASFNKVLEAARTAGGRVSTSQLNEQNAVNMTGTLDFDVPRESLPRLDAALHEAGLTTVRNVTRSPDSESTVDSKVRFTLTLIDEINLTARQTVGQTVAARDVPVAFNRLADAVRDAGARVVTSQLADQDKPTVNGLLTFSVERADLPRVESAIREAGETVGRNITRSADLQNTVDTKVLYQVMVRDQRSLDARETIAEKVAVHDVPGRFERVRQTLLGLPDAQVINSQLNEQNRHEVSAVLEFTVRRDGTGGGGAGGPGAKDAREQAAVEKALGDSADVFGRSVTRSPDPAALDTKVHYSVTLIDADTQKPRETFTMAAEVADVDRALADLEAAAVAAGGRAVESTPVTSKSDKGETIGKVILDVPLSRAGEIVNAVRDKGRVTMTQRSRDDQVPEGTLSRARVEVTVGTGAIMAGEGSLWDSIKSGLRTSGTGLLWTLQLIIVGLCLIGPWALLVWVAWRLVRRARRRPAPPGPATPPVPA